MKQTLSKTRFVSGFDRHTKFSAWPFHDGRFEMRTSSWMKNGSGVAAF
jgi:hypothetical protein